MGGPEQQQRCDRAAWMRALLRDMFQGQKVVRVVYTIPPEKKPIVLEEQRKEWRDLHHVTPHAWRA